MNKREFIDLLVGALDGRVPSGIISEKADYYRDYISGHAREHGMTEEEVIEEIGPPEAIAHTIVEVYEAENGPYTGGGSGAYGSGNGGYSESGNGGYNNGGYGESGNGGYSNGGYGQSGNGGYNNGGYGESGNGGYSERGYGQEDDNLDTPGILEVLKNFVANGGGGCLIAIILFAIAAIAVIGGVLRFAAAYPVIAIAIVILLYVNHQSKKRH